MLTPKELFNSYSTQPCTEYFTNNVLYGTGLNGKGTPHYMRRTVHFMKHLKYPCISRAPHYSRLYRTGSNQLCLTYKFLEALDSECFKEIQPTIQSGTSHNIRNACDISRACLYTVHDMQKAWEHRMATEYLQRFGKNSLPDCLMALGPDLVSDNIAHNFRAPNFEALDCLPIAQGGSHGPGATGGTWGCMTPPGPTESKPQCRSCDFCPEGSEGSNDPCCNFEKNRYEYINLCCKAGLTSRANFSYLKAQDTEEDATNIIPNRIRFINANSFSELKSAIEGRPYSGPMSFQEIESHREWFIRTMRWNDGFILNDGNLYLFRPVQFSGFLLTYRDLRAYRIYSPKIKHIGILPRKIYGGYANLLDNSGSNFYATLDDIFIDHFHRKNNFDYDNSVSTLDLELPSDRERFLTNLNNNIARARTISMLNANPEIAVQEIKDLLYNGYGVVFFSNVGFPNSRDSQGISYPDRMWYATYSILGYDDTKSVYDECVFILHCPWGKWNSGGQPYWGDLPDGAFLVKEQHLKCMLRYYPDRDYYGCRSLLPCNPVVYDCDNPRVIKELEGCGHGPAEKCEQYFCASQQSAMGIGFAISLNEGFPLQNLDHFQWLPKKSYLLEESTMYYKY